MPEYRTSEPLNFNLNVIKSTADHSTSTNASPTEALNNLSYFWQYRVPREVLFSTPGLNVTSILELEEDSLTHDEWLSFELTEQEALEKAFSDPSVDLFVLKGEISKNYPFFHRTEIWFENITSLEGSIFKMITRLKKENDSNDYCSCETVFQPQPTKKVELQVRRIPAPSRSGMSSECTRAIHWCWWLENRNLYFGLQSDAPWIKFSVQLTSFPLLIYE
jgi:hypothetical protein